uniref:TLDc domain-containing protein n=1 Tax=Entamoeba invadens TaxID=33085 RepID=S0B067_ENTIV|nr:hypothetical protein [Entamoeba invadens]
MDKCGTTNSFKTLQIENFQNFGTVNFYGHKNLVNNMGSTATSQTNTLVVPEKKEFEEVKPLIVPLTKELPPDTRVINKFALTEKNLDKLKDWTKCSKFQVVYSNENEPLYARDFYAKVKGLKNVVVLAETTTGQCFGGFFGKIPEKQNTWVTEDLKHFVFTLRNPVMIPPTPIYPRIDNRNILLIRDNAEPKVVLENCAFVVCNDGSSRQHIRFSSTYHDTTFKGERLFAGNQKLFQIRNFAALCWEE